MNAKRILPWENWDEGHWEAETKVEDYHVQHHDYRDDTAGYEAYCGNDWPRELGVFDTPGQAIDACEADYIARCTEFLRVAGPGECVVKVEDVADTATFMLATKKGAGIIRDGVLVTPDYIRERLTAAIDAAKGE